MEYGSPLSEEYLFFRYVVLVLPFLVFPRTYLLTLGIPNCSYTLSDSKDPIYGDNTHPDGRI